MRVFAMVDPWTQLVMYPFHKALFRILNKHPMDGTFNQLAPLNRAWKFSSLYSMDLSAATDRLPMSIQVPLIKELFQLTDAESNAWSSLLVDRDYAIGNSGESVRYTVGQPMGALSSWAMLAMTHHLIVQVAAWKAGHPQTKLFRDYAVLGDDIVIFNKKVSKYYHELIISLGVECNLAKSILSYKGIGLEFAKKTFYRGVNISPTPLKELYAALESPNGLLQYGKTYNLNLSQLLHVAGFGYKVKGSCNQPLWKIKNHKVRTLIMSLYLTDPSLFPKLFNRFRGSKMGSGLLEFSISNWTIKSLNEFTTRLDKNLKRVYAIDISHFNPALSISENVRLERILEKSRNEKERLLSHLFQYFYQPYLEEIRNLYKEGFRSSMQITNRFYTGKEDLQSKVEFFLAKVTDMVHLDQKLSTLSKDNLVALRTDYVPGVRTPKAHRMFESYNNFIHSVVSPISKDLRGKPEKVYEGSISGIGKTLKM